MHARLFTAAALLLSAGTPALAVQHYNLTELTTGSAPRTINNAGMIAGEIGALAGRLDDGSAPFALPTGYTSELARGISGIGRTALIIQGGANDLAGIGFPNGSVTYLAPLVGNAAAGAYGIYNGKYVGYSLSSGTLSGAAGTPSPAGSARGTLHAVVWNGFTAATALTNPFGTDNSVATAVNFNGMVGGIVLDTSRRQRGVVWAADGTATILGLQAGQARSSVRDINEGGDLLGQTTGNSGPLATVWSHGQVYTLSTLGGFDGGNGRGINDRGIAVGFGSNSNDGSLQGMYWSFNGSGYDAYALDSLVANLGGWQTGAAQSINDDGTIVGFGTRADGTSGAYILTAVPEPASWAMMVAGFGLIGVCARRRVRGSVTA
jgi:hypothetical protein